MQSALVFSHSTAAFLNTSSVSAAFESRWAWTPGFSCRPRSTLRSGACSIVRALEDGSFTTEYPVYSGTRTLLLNLNRLERDGVVFGVSVFGQDITERKKAEDALRESEAKYRRLYESMMDGYVLVDMDGRILKYNESYRDMTGYEPEELLAADLPGSHDRGNGMISINEIIERQVLSRGYSEVYEKEYRKKDGTRIPDRTSDLSSQG